ncbi:ROK family protein [Halalkalibacter kiskunsagensis]|uniref:ROK family protein n=1 Tax=Halalkalibacter kiskunsagensis TaxID=1548599 RepID=A0ABV6KKL1_9BACI
MNNVGDVAIGLDLGGTKILAALISKDGKVINQTESETSKQGQDGIYTTILTTITKLLVIEDINPNRLKGIGVASAGIIDSTQNVIQYAKNLGMKNFPIGSLLEAHFQLPVKLVNDANAAAVAEWIWGAGRKKRNLVYITVSTGVGAGIISNGRLLTGANDCAGEFGHISIMHNGIQCECGNRGCLEKYTSGTAIAKIANERLLAGESSSLGSIKSGDVTSKHLAAAAEEGDVFSINLLKEVGEYLGTGVNNLIHLFNPEVIVFGGGVMNMSRFIVPSIKEAVRTYGISHMAKGVTIETSTLGKKAGVMGASGLFFANDQHDKFMSPSL